MDLSDHTSLFMGSRKINSQNSFFTVADSVGAIGCEAHLRESTSAVIDIQVIASNLLPAAKYGPETVISFDPGILQGFKRIQSGNCSTFVI